MAGFLGDYGLWLLFGLFMFLMMRRGGCCSGHGSHGNHGSHGDGGHGSERSHGGHGCCGSHDSHTEKVNDKSEQGGDNMSSHGETNEQKALITVEGMTCGHCKAAVEKAVASVDGVSKVEVDLGRKEAVVLFNPDRTGEEELKKVIRDQGYQVP